MATLLKVSKSSPSIPRARRRLAMLTMRLAQVAEDLVEEYNEYSPEFLASVEQSLKDLRQGKVRRITSLSELS